MPRTVPPPPPGTRFGNLVLLDEPPIVNKRGWKLVRVRCDCGASCLARLDNLKRGRVRSCGCLKYAVLRARNVAQWTPTKTAWVESQIKAGKFKRSRRDRLHE